MIVGLLCVGGLEAEDAGVARALSTIGLVR